MDKQRRKTMMVTDFVLPSGRDGTMEIMGATIMDYAKIRDILRQQTGEEIISLTTRWREAYTVGELK